MTEKTSIEAKHYDQKAANVSIDSLSNETSLSNNDRLLRKAHLHFQYLVRNILDEKKKGLILDYGCGTGFKNFGYASADWKIYGIDISEVSIAVAGKAAKEKNVNAIYQVMDCEKMSFADSFFDVILDYGSFSSLDMQKAFPDIVRVLKPDGVLIAIETFGHNPITNLKRWISVLRGRRTKWATAHIMKTKDWKTICRQFGSCEIHYFGFFVLFIGPFSRICPDFLLRFYEGMDRLFFKIKFFRRYAFKTVVVMKNPIKK